MKIEANGFQPSKLSKDSIKLSKSSQNLISPFNTYKRELSLFSAITLPLILAACGGGGGGGAVSPTPDAGSGSSSSSDSDSGSTATAGINLDGGSYAATPDADTFIVDVSFDGTSIVSLDNDSIITGFDPANDSILLRGSGASSDFNAASLVGSTGVEVSQSTINNNTIIYFSPNSSNNSSSVTLAGVLDGDLSTITVSTEEGSANDSSASTSGGTDLASGTVAATDAADAFVYEIKFSDNSPVAIDGEVVITGFDVDNDTLTLQAASAPSGFSKSSLLTAANVDVTTNTIDNYTLISFAPDASGSSGSIKLEGVVDADLSSININILAGSVSSSGPDLSTGSNIELGTTNLTAQTDAENFVFDATYSSSTLSGVDGPVTISNFNQDNDKIVVLAADMPVGYDLDDFKSSAGVDIVASTIDNNTVIYFAPDENGNSTSIILDGVVDSGLSNTSIEFTSSLSGETSSGTATSSDTGASSESTSTADTSSDTSSTDTSSTDTSSTDTSSTDTSSTDTSSDTSSTDTSSETTTTNVIDVDLSAEGTVSGTDAADEFRYEFNNDGTSVEGNFKITLDNFDSANDKVILVNKDGSSMTIEEFATLSGVDVVNKTFDGGISIAFAPDAAGSNGELYIDGVTGYDSSAYTFDSLVLEIKAEADLASSSSSDFG